MVSNELIDVLFFDKIEQFLSFYKNLKEKFYPHNPNEYMEEFNNYLLS